MPDPRPHVPSPRRAPDAEPALTVDVIKVALPTPDGAVIVDGGRVAVVLDPRLSDVDVEKLCAAALLLAELTHLRVTDRS